MSKLARRRLHALHALVSGQNPLFEAKRFDWVESRRAIGRIKAETDPDGRADDEPGDSPPVGEDEIDFQPSGQQITANHSKNNSEDSAGFGNEDRLCQKLPQNIATPG